MDETYIKINSQWKYLYRAVDKAGQTIDFLLTAHRDKKAALRFLKKAIRHHGLPEKVTIDKSSANTAAVEALQEETNRPIEKRQIKYLNNLVEQDHRAIKRLTRPMLGFNTFRSARITLQGIELMHMIKSLSENLRHSKSNVGTGQIEHCLVIFGFLLPANEQAPKPVHPGM